MRIRAAAIALLLMVAGCGGNPNTVDGSRAGPSPVVLKDTSPGQLSALISLNMGGYDLAARSKLLLDINFEHGGRPVEFIADEQVECDGLSLKRYRGGSFEAEIQIGSIAAKALACAYRWQGQSAALTVPVPAMLEIVSPIDHERVSHSRQTVVRYNGALNTDVWVVALSPNAKAVAQPRDIRASEAILDTSALGTGDGSIALTDPNNIPLTDLRAPAFQSVTGSARRMTMVAVVWV